MLFQAVFDTAPTTAAAQNSIQNSLANTPDFIKETPERALIAASLVAVALVGYLIAQKVRE
jgi:hypothetical protein